MSAKKWLISFVCVVLALALLVIGFNGLVDPFGVFTGDILEWPSYEMTNNPRTAKATYLKEHHDEYDSYIIGCSSSSSWSVETLNAYYDASFYNLIMYGADMLDVEQFSRWLVENYTVKNLIVSLYIDNAIAYDTETNPLSYGMAPDVSDENKWTGYCRYLVMDPRYSLKKLAAFTEDTWLPQKFDVFNAQTGTYDKRARDAEPIGDLEQYLQNYPVFADYPQKTIAMSSTAVDGTMESLRVIRELCAANGIHFEVFCVPVYAAYWDYFAWSELEMFYTRLASVTPYWDFSYSSVSFEPRYFYDETHFRNSVGNMALARRFDDTSVYYPADFGAYVTTENVGEHMEALKSVSAAESTSYTAEVPVLMFHHIAEEGNGSTILAADNFEAQIKALWEAGYTAVSVEAMRDYVYSGAELPEKPVVITFDDGYLSNYEYAYPILQEYGFCATIFVIGSSIGAETYKNTGNAIYPHFTAEQAAEMTASGVISIQSHTFDMHQSAAYETGRARENILAWEDEDDAAYVAALTADCQYERTVIENATGETVFALAYPTGVWNTLTQAVLQQNGYQVTFATTAGTNTLVRGLPQSLLALNRYNVTDALTPEALLTLLES